MKLGRPAEYDAAASELTAARKTAAERRGEGGGAPNQRPGDAGTVFDRSDCAQRTGPLDGARVGRDWVPDCDECG